MGEDGSLAAVPSDFRKRASTADRITAAYRRLERFREGGLVGAILLTGLIFTLVNSSFAHLANVENIASQISFEGVLAVSMTFVLITGEIDLSIGSMVAVCAVIFGLLLQDHVPLVLAVILTFAAGTAMGVINGILSIALRVPTIIITLGMLNAYRGLADQLANGYPLENFSTSSPFFTIGTGKLFGVLPYTALVLIVFAILSAFVLRRTRTGLHVYAMGSDRRAAELAGLNIARIRVAVLAFNGFAAALSALLAVSQSTTADPNLGNSYELDVIAAVVIGGAKLTGGSGTVLASVLGMLLIGTITNGLVIVGVSLYLLVVVSGLIVIAAVAIDRLFVRRREASVR